MPEGFLVIVTGPPGAGKTTLAPRIAERLGAVCISRDFIQEAIFDGWEPRHPALDGDGGLGSAPASSPAFNAGKVSWDIFLWMLRQVASVVPTVAESPFNHAITRERFEVLRAELRVPVVEVFLSAPADVLMRRIEGRASAQDAHPIKVHFTLEPARELLAGPYDPLIADAARRIDVDTTDLATVDIDAIAQSVRSLVAPA